MTLIGSAAIKYYFPNFPRKPKDVDVLISSRYSAYSAEVRIEYHDILPLWTRYAKLIAVPPDALYTLKLSHILWDIKWDKHIFDLMWLKREGHCILMPELFDELYTFWISKKGEPVRANLNMSKADFFDNALDNQDSHDKLHEALNSPPTYTKILVGEVLTSDEKFQALSYQEKLNLIHEETCVMAYERLAGRHYRSAYSAQLKQMILHHLPFEQALFAADNYYELRKPFVNYKEVLDDWNRNHLGIQ